MNSTDVRPLFRCADALLVRAAAHRELVLPTWPDLTVVTPSHVRRWCAWLRDVWAVNAVAEAVTHASPVLATEVESMCAGHVSDARRARRIVLSVARYVLRMTGRATPFGLFAGVAPARFGARPAERSGGGNRVVVRPDSRWLAEMITRLESCVPLLERLPVVANNLCFVRGRRLVVPYQPAPDGGDRATEVSMRYTPAVRTAVEEARSPIRCEELVGKLAAEFPTAPPAAFGDLLTELVRRGVLITSLRAPSTITDAFGYLLEQLDAVEAYEIPAVAGLLSRLREVDLRPFQRDHAALSEIGRAVRRATRDRTTARTTSRRPVAMDLRLDCSLTLPREVADEVEVAASVLARLSPYPFGTAEWQSYHRRFFERYGIGALVPVMDVVDPDLGLGFPAGYAGSATPAPPIPVSARDERLLALAQEAALEQRDEVVLDDGLVADLGPPDLDRARMPPHLELCAQIRATSRAALGRGEFELAIVSVSRGIGTLSGRFISLLKPHDQQRMAAMLARLPVSDTEATPVQLSFTPLSPDGLHVTRAPALLSDLISLGEHRGTDDRVIAVEDLAVACDAHRLYLASLASGRRLEPTMLHALELRHRTPPLARFLAEVGRGQASVVTGFDWGVARHLPYLPRVRYRRTVLSPARWLLSPAELPGREAPWAKWREAMTTWRTRRCTPSLVYLTEGDRRLPLDLDHDGHLVLLRAHLDSARQTVLTEAPTPRAHTWFDGRAHEIVFPLVAAHPASWPALPKVTRMRALGRGHGHLPGTSRWLYAKLYGHPERHAELLAEYLPELLAEWDEPPAWWFIRYRDPDWHLRLRIALQDPGRFGPAAQRVSSWAGRLHRLGLLQDLQFATYRPETGRWGKAAAMDAAESVFGADSHALLAQFAEPSRPHPQVLTAANFVAIAAGFTGSSEAGMHWLIEHAKTQASPAPPRPILAEAVSLADPADDWANLRTAPGGKAITATWEARRRALAAYRSRLATAEGIDPEAVLVSLLHAHHVRAVGIDTDDERTCLRLARAAALTWNARSGRDGT